MGEFEIIERYFSHLGGAGSDIILGVGDDCAIVSPPPGQHLCCSMDAMVEGVHFPVAYAPRYIARRALGAALSDLAAMGAKPSHFTLSLTMPDADASWLEAFASGLAHLAHQTEISLIGGDLTAGPLTVVIQVHGWVPAGQAVQRSGAQPGDIVVVSGTLGDARAALDLLGGEAGSEAERYLLERYHRPEPRLALGRALRHIATAGLDISDGLMADAAHIAKASGCAVQLDAASVPISGALLSCFPELAHDYALSGGDDYELLLTMRPEDWSQAARLAGDCSLTRIGTVAAGQGVVVEGRPEVTRAAKKGYQHFD